MLLSTISAPREPFKTMRVGATSRSPTPAAAVDWGEQGERQDQAKARRLVKVFEAYSEQIRCRRQD